MVASASTTNYALPVPATTDLVDFNDIDSLSNKVDAQLLIASAMGSQVAYNSLIAPVTQAVNGTAYAGIAGATLLLPNDAHYYRVVISGTSFRSTLTGTVRLSLGTAVAAQLKRYETTVAATGAPYGPLSIVMGRILASGQLLQVFVFGPATAGITVDATVDSPLELAAYRIG